MMKKPPQGRSGRRPHPGKGGRDRRNFDPDFHFKKDVKKDILEFLSGEEQTLTLAPMNSYKRRIAHELAKEFKLESSSEGEGEDRHNVLTRNEDSYKPTEEEIHSLTHHDFGNEEFFVAQVGSEPVEIFLYSDGAFGIFSEHSDAEQIDSKKITGGSFKIKNNKIIDFNSLEW